MNDLVLPSAIQQAIMNWIAGATGPFENSTIRLYKAFTGTLTNQTTLAQFTESSFQGYAGITGQSPIGVFQDMTNRWRAKFDSQEWDVANGFQQIIDNTLVGTITMTGTIIVTVTAAGMTGSPVAVTVNVTDLDTPAEVAGKVVTALNANADVGAFFTASANGAVVTLTAITPAANDATMNAAYTLGTATGLTPNPTSTQVQAGVAPVAPNESALGVYVTDSTGTQYRGAAAFPAPIPLTQAYQAVTAWPDIPYGG